jgi:hypothetical protein
MEQRIPFNQLFQQLPDGALTPLRIININGVVMGPGVIFHRGALFGGVDIFNFIGRVFATRIENDVVTILGFYN